MSNRDAIGRFFRTYGASAVGDTPLQPLLPPPPDAAAEEPGKVDRTIESPEDAWSARVGGEAPAKAGEHPVRFIDGSLPTLPVLCLRSPQGWPVPVLIGETEPVSLLGPPSETAAILARGGDILHSARSWQRAGRRTLKMCLVQRRAETDKPNSADAVHANEVNRTLRASRDEETILQISRCALLTWRP